MTPISCECPPSPSSGQGWLEGVMVGDLHDVVSWVFVIVNGAAAALALAAHSIESLRGRHVWVAIGLAWTIVIVQTALGAALQIQREIDAGTHQVYGFVAFGSLSIIYAGRNEMRDRPYLLFGLGTLWITGLGIRSMFLS
ncbi:MAG: hypothetical protein P8P85_04910 [Acidimicrobiales bacterium]|nr:hypothetical protein [Acidimicrobiales bacterium]